VEKREEFQLMQPFLRQLSPESRILDGGCGMGEWTVFLANQGYQTVGLDISKHTIERLQKVLPTYQFVSGDIRHTDFAAASFDAYFSWGTFEHFENGLAECVQEAYRILKPGGYLFVSVPYQNWRHSWQGIRWRNKNSRKALPQKSSRPSPPMRFYQWRLTRAELARELSMQGFYVLNVVPIHKKHGLKRTLHHDFGMKRGGLLNRKITRYFRRLIPANWVAHMIMGIAQKLER
jgi:ubiquinone/menaquinone biosynthesis C-methylase UbiE